MSVEGSVEHIISVLEERALGHDIDIVDVEVVGSTKAPVVRVRIDHADENGKTISLDEVAAETGWISDALDEIDVFPGSFTLEVSSPGMPPAARMASICTSAIDSPSENPRSFINRGVRPISGRSSTGIAVLS